MISKKNSAKFVAAVMFGVMVAEAQASDAAWNANASGDWTTNSSWTPGTAPGGVVGNTDTATWGSSINGKTINVDAGRYIGNMTFANNAGSMTLSGGSLTLTNNGNITINGSVANTTATIATPITLPQTYSLYTSATTGVLTRRMSIDGGMTGPSGTAATLYLRGAQPGDGGANTYSRISSTGMLQDGPSGGTLALNKMDGGTWDLSGGSSATATSGIGSYSSNASSIALGSLPVGLVAGDRVYGTGIPAGTTITNINGLTLTLSQNTTAASSTGGLSYTGFTGGVTLNAGKLLLRGSAPIGTGTFTINGGILGGVAGIVTNNLQVWNGDFSYGDANSGLNLGSGAVSLGTATGTTRTISIGNATGTLTVNGLISNGTTATTVGRSGAGTLNLGNNSNAFSNLTVQGGTVAASNVIAGTSNNYPTGGTSLGTPFGTGTITLSGSGRLSLNVTGGGPTGSDINYGQLTNNIVLAGDGGMTMSSNAREFVMYSGLISGSGKLLLSCGQQGSQDPSGMVLQHANNSYTGGTELKTTSNASSAKALFIADAANALGGGDGTAGTTGIGGVVSFVSAGNSTNPLTAHSSLILKSNQAIAGLSGDYNRTYVSGYSTSGQVSLTLSNTSGGTGDNSSFAGLIGSGVPAGAAGISGSIAGGNNLKLIKAGTGTQTLARPNTYTGGTDVNGGTLLLSGGATPAVGTRTGTTGTKSQMIVTGINTAGLAIGQFAYGTPTGNLAPQIVSIDPANNTIVLSGNAATNTSLSVSLTFSGLASAAAASRTTTAASTSNVSTFTLNDVSGLVVGQWVSGPTNFPSASQITAIDTTNKIITVNGSVSSGNTVNSNSTISFYAVSGAGAGPLAVNSNTDNAAATLGGTGAIVGAVTLNTPTGTGRTNRITGGTVGTVGTLNLMGGVTFQSNSTYYADFGAGANNADKLAITGAASVSGASLVLNQLSTPDQAKYTLATAASGLSGFTATGTPAAYRVNQGGSALELIHRGTFGTVTANAVDAAIIKGGSTAINFSVPNTAPTGSDGLSFSGTGTSNVIGSASGSATPQGDSGSVSGLSFSSTTTGLAVSGSFAVSDPSAGPSTSASGSVTVRVWDHALPTFQSGTNTVDFGNKHIGYSGPGSDVTIQNTAGNYVPAKSSGVTGSNGSIAGFGGLGQGSSTSVTPSLTLNTAGSISETLQLSYDDDSSLNGAVPHIGVGNVTIQGHVYTGKSTWQGGSSWSSTGNWDYAGGVPGVDGSLSAGLDSATFGATGVGSVDLDTSVQLKTLALNASGYTITTSGGKSINLSGSSPSITASGTQAINAGLQLGTDTNVAVSASGDVLTIGGAIGGSGKLLKSGSGKLVLSGISSVSLDVASGNVELTGSGSVGDVTFSGSGTLTNNSSAPLAGPISITNGSVLNGNGTMGGLVTVQNGGTLSPGNSPGTITFESGVTFESGSTFKVELASPSSYDVALVTGGNVELGGTTLNLLPGYAPDGTTTYWVVNNTGAGNLSGTFAGWSNGDTVLTDGQATYRVYYHGDMATENPLAGTGNDVAIMVTIPEPSTVAMVIGLSGMLAVGRRRRHR